MKKNSFYIILSAFALFSLGACKDKDKKPDNEIEDTTPKEIDNYLPSTVGTWWLYNSTDGEQYKREATGLDSMKAGYKMKYFTLTRLSDMNPDAEYFNRFDETDYYTLFTFDSATAYEEPNFIPIIVMKDNPSIGMTWKNTGLVNYDSYGDITIEANCKIESTTDRIELDDTTFTNAIRMKASLRGRNAVTSWVDAGSVTYWFVKRVGVVKQDYNIKLALPVVGTLFEKNHIEVLKDYEIKY